MLEVAFAETIDPAVLARFDAAVWVLMEELMEREPWNDALKADISE